MSTLSGRAPSDNKILGRKTLPCCKKGAHVLGEQIQQLRHQNIHGSYTHAEMRTHKGLHFFNSHCAPDKNCSKRVSDSPFESPYFFWRFSQTNSTGVLFYSARCFTVLRKTVFDCNFNREQGKSHQCIQFIASPSANRLGLLIAIPSSSLITLRDGVGEHPAQQVRDLNPCCKIWIPMMLFLGCVLAAAAGSYRH